MGQRKNAENKLISRSKTFKNTKNRAKKHREMPLTRIFRCRKSLMQQAFPGFWRDAEKPRKISKKSRLACANATKKHVQNLSFQTCFLLKLAERKGFEPLCGLTRKLISSQPRYDHFDTSPYISAHFCADKIIS